MMDLPLNMPLPPAPVGMPGMPPMGMPGMPPVGMPGMSLPPPQMMGGALLKW